MDKYLQVWFAGLALAGCAPQVDNWNAVVEYDDGSSEIVEFNVTNEDCIAFLDRPEFANVPVSYCEKVS